MIIDDVCFIGATLWTDFNLQGDQVINANYANSRMQRGQTKQNPPSRFIGELPEELMKQYDLAGGGRNTYDSGPKIDVGDRVKHKLFGEGEVMEVRNSVSIVKLNNPKF